MTIIPGRFSVACVALILAYCPLTGGQHDILGCGPTYAGTAGGAECADSFVYAGVLYNACTQDGSDMRAPASDSKFWCYTEAGSDPMALDTDMGKRWGYCNRCEDAPSTVGFAVEEELHWVMPQSGIDMGSLPWITIACVQPPSSAPGWVDMKGGYETYFDWLLNERGGISVGGVKHYVRFMKVHFEGKNVADTVRDLFDLGVELFLGPFGLWTELVADEVQKNGGILIAPGASAPSIFQDRSNIFGLIPPMSLLVDQVVTGIPLELHGPPTSLACVQDTSDYGEDVCKGMQTLADKLGVQNTIKVTMTDGLFSPPLTQLVTTQPDVIISGIQGWNCEALFAALAEVDVNPRLVLITGCVQRQYLSSWDPRSLQFMIGVAPWTSQTSGNTCELTGLTSNDFVQRFLDRYGVLPYYNAAAAFTAAALLVHAIETAGNVNPAEVAPVIQTMKVKTFYATVDFNTNGQILAQNVYGIQMLVSGELALVYKNGAPTRELIYPQPSKSVINCLYVDPSLHESLNGAMSGGQYGLNGVDSSSECLRCEPGSIGRVAPGDDSAEYLSRFARLECTMCPIGKHHASDDNRQLCNDCAPGTYADVPMAEVCKRCEPGRFQSKLGGSACELCPPGKFQDENGRSMCTPCSNYGDFGEQATRFYSALEGSTRCHRCPRGAVCTPDRNNLFTGYIAIKGYAILWADEDKRPVVPPMYQLGQVFRCLVRQSCMRDMVHSGIGLTGQGGSMVNGIGESSNELRRNNACAVGNTGPLCGSCTSGYGKATATIECLECMSPFVNLMFIVANVVLFFLAGFMLFGVNLIVNPAMPTSTFTECLRILMNYSATMVFIHTVTDHRLENIDLGEFFAWISVFVASEPLLESSLAIDCLAKQYIPSMELYQVTVILGFCAFPALLLADFFLVQAIQFVLRALSREPMSAASMKSMFLIQTYLLHMRLLTTFSVPFECAQYDVLRHVWDTRIICDGGDYEVWHWVSLFGYFLFGLGIPLALLFAIVRAYKAGLLYEGDGFRMYGAFISGYLPGTYFFEIVFMFRKFIFATIMIAPNLRPIERRTDAICLVALAITTFSLARNYKYSPYDTRSYHLFAKLEFCMMSSVFVTLAMHVWVQASHNTFFFSLDGEWGDMRRNFRDIAAFFVVCLSHTCFFVMLASGVYRSGSKGYKACEAIMVTKWGVRGAFLDYRSKRLFANGIVKMAKKLGSMNEVLEQRRVQRMLEMALLSSVYWRKKMTSHVDSLAEDKHLYRFETISNIINSVISVEDVHTAVVTLCRRPAIWLNEPSQPAHDKDPEFDVFSGFDEDPEFNVFPGFDAFPGEDAKQASAVDLNECKSTCKRELFGAFVVHCGVAHFRSRSSKECDVNKITSPGKCLYIWRSQTLTNAPSEGSDSDIEKFQRRNEDVRELATDLHERLIASIKDMFVLESELELLEAKERDRMTDDEFNVVVEDVPPVPRSHREATQLVAEQLHGPGNDAEMPNTQDGGALGILDEAHSNNQRVNGLSDAERTELLMAEAEAFRLASTLEKLKHEVSELRVQLDA